MKKWISSDICPFKMRPLSSLEMLSSKYLVAECSVAEWWSPPVLTMFWRHLLCPSSGLSKKTLHLLGGKKKEYFWAALKMEAASFSKSGKCLPLNMVSCEKTWIFISPVWEPCVFLSKQIATLYFEYKYTKKPFGNLEIVIEIWCFIHNNFGPPKF